MRDILDNSDSVEDLLEFLKENEDSSDQITSDQLRTEIIPLISRIREVHPEMGKIFVRYSISYIHSIELILSEISPHSTFSRARLASTFSNRTHFLKLSSVLPFEFQDEAFAVLVSLAKDNALGFRFSESPIFPAWQCLRREGVFSGEKKIQETI